MILVHVNSIYTRFSVCGVLLQILDWLFNNSIFFIIFLFVESADNVEDFIWFYSWYTGHTDAVLEKQALDDQDLDMKQPIIWTRRKIAHASLVVCPFWFLAQYTFNLSLKYTTVTVSFFISLLHRQSYTSTCIWRVHIHASILTCHICTKNVNNIEISLFFRITVI